ncbi:hypothetical protein HPB52_019552 [Rhipicephalus sanguineus]|uniref:Peptidase M13 C-terminal domain-containing protein n=1 Tax=Rhipicephalus sanguineus TaxID=34632 RepID=A0A9D4PIC0_RHISA|nr:hypothetical protein HPB52_019552 [Rhipicephalus sanguineus]
MAEKHGDESHPKSTEGQESSALRAERVSAKTKYRGSTPRVSRGRHDCEATSEPRCRHSGRTRRDETDSHTSVSGYTEATVGPALEYFPVTSTDTSQPQPSAGSDHVPPKTSPTLQYITAPTDKAAPPPDGTKDGHEKHSKRKSSRRRSSSVRKRSSDAGSSTSSGSQRAPSEKDRDDSAPARHGSPGRHPSQTDGKEQLTASTAQASVSQLRPHVTHHSAEQRITTTGMLCGALFVVCVAAASITLVIMSYGESTNEVACVAPRCLEVRSDLYGLVNATADPCVNFYDHVCGHWMDRESGGSFRDDNVRASQVKLQQAIASGRYVKYETEGASVLNQVYAACERYMATETTLAEIMRAADALLSLSTLRRADSNAKVAGFLMRTSIETGLYTVATIMIVRDGAEEPLYLAPSWSLTKRFLRNGDVKDARTSDNDSWRFILQVLEAFPDVQNATSVAQLLYWLDADLNMALQLPRKPVVERSPLDVAFEGLVDGVTVTQWMKAANMILPAWRALGRRGVVLMRNPKIVKNVFGVLFSKGTRTAALYVSAYVASYVAVMERDKLRVRSGEITVPWSCLNRASECLTKTWPQLVGKLVNSQGSVPIIEDMFATIKKVSTYPKVFTWLGERSRALASEELASTPAVIQEPIDPKVNYSGLDISGSAHGDNGSLFTRSNTLEDDSFVSQYILARRHDLQVRRVSPPTLRELYSVRHGYSGDVAYSQRVGVVVVPGLYQMEPYVYNSDVPAYFSYGTVGALLASQVAKIMHPNYAGVRQSGSWWARDTHDRYSRRIRCLVDLHYRLGFKDHVAGSPQEQQATMYTVVQGLRLAFDSMEADFRDHAPNYGVFSAYWPEAVRIFFMRYCLLWCSASQRPNPLTPREMCLLPVHNMPEFAEAFGCSKSARYVKGRCRM